MSRCENGPQALLKAQAALNASNMWFIDATLVMPGSIAMASGITVNLTGFGEFDGVYIVLVANHRLDGFMDIQLAWRSVVFFNLFGTRPENASDPQSSALRLGIVQDQDLSLCRLRVTFNEFDQMLSYWFLSWCPRRRTIKHIGCRTSANKSYA